MSLLKEMESAPMVLIDVTEENVPAVAAAAWAALRAVNHPGQPQFVRVGNTACIRTEEGLEALERASPRVSLNSSALSALLSRTHSFRDFRHFCARETGRNRQ